MDNIACSTPADSLKLDILNSAADTSYEPFAENYLSTVDEKPYTAYYERPAMISLLPEKLDGKNIMDAGCGSGFYSEYLVKKGASVSALDASRKMLEYTRKRAGNNIKCVLADISKPLPEIKDGTVDIIVASLIMHYIKDWAATFLEFHRILKKDGSLIFSIHHPINDYLLFNKKGYFETELIEDEWKGFAGGPLKVKYYVRPMGGVMSPLVEAGFKIDKFLEPRPVPECREKYPKTFEKLSKEPGFLLIRAQK
ncbi:MAG TPA: methyltransferase domain-containing protein [Candidatus Wallbacteria bacterium]|nr:methyltransferase domain-containing protein [Candidatus Wallbacteria bacterium]